MADTAKSIEQSKQWYVLRDFKKRNAKSPGYKLLPENGVRCFTPMHWVVSSQHGKLIREYVPVVQSLLFAYDTKENLDPIIQKDRALQFQYRRGAGKNYFMTVPEAEMERFIKAVSNDLSPIYFTPEELTPDKIGKKIRVSGGPLDGYTGVLLKMRGTRKRRLLIKIEGFLVAAVEVNPEFVQFI
ncbi:MAG: UpxY family transcription antiterminator [Muribaculum sp.]|nr:UpxY family transcription antiterminator [Muribaculum sp.]